MGNLLFEFRKFGFISPRFRERSSQVWVVSKYFRIKQLCCSIIGPASSRNTLSSTFQELLLHLPFDPCQLLKFCSEDKHKPIKEKSHHTIIVQDLTVRVLCWDKDLGL